MKLPNELYAHVFCDIIQCSSKPGGSLCKNGYCDDRRVYEWLRECERIGTLDDLSALANARNEGRVAVLPCKVGTPIWYIDVSVEPNECGKWVTRKRVKSTKLDYSVMDWIDTPIYFARAEAEADVAPKRGVDHAD